MKVVRTALLPNAESCRKFTFLRLEIFEEIESENKDNEYMYTGFIAINIRCVTKCYFEAIHKKNQKNNRNGVDVNLHELAKRYIN